MKKGLSLKSIVILLVVIAVVLCAYFYYEGSGTAGSSLLSAPVGSDAGAIGTQVLSLLNQIQSLRIDSTLFTDPGYQTLRDYSVAVPPENVGRANPFAPLPGAPAPQADGSTGN